MNPPALPAFADDTFWMLQGGASAAVAGPGGAGPLTAAIGRLGLEPSDILVKHRPASLAALFTVARVCSSRPR